MDTPEMHHRRNAAVFALAIMAMLLVTWQVYRPGLAGSFLLDDLGNLQQLGESGGINDLQTAANFVFGNRSGPLGRPAAMASFLMDSQNWPAPVQRFKYTNLLLHLLNGLLTVWFSILVFRHLKVEEKRAQLLALGVAGLWLLHPLNVSTTLYVVQRMTELMTVFALAGLICYVKGRSLAEGQHFKGLLLMSLGLFPFGLLAVLSKENGALLLVAILALEFTLFAGTARSLWQRLWLAAAVLLPLGVVAVYIVLNFADLTAGFQYREFSVGERLLTESRVLIDYLVNIFLPGIGSFTLHHDDVDISRNLLEPLSTLPALASLAGLLVTGVVLRRRQPVLGFAIFWFFGWHLLESTFLPLELYFEHRNYIAMIGPLLAAVYYINRLLEYRHSAIAFLAVPGTLALTSLSLAFLTYQLSSLWGNPVALQAHWAARHPDSYRAQVEYGYLLASLDESRLGYPYIANIQQAYSGEVGLQLLHWNYACSYGLPAPYPLQRIAATDERVYFRADLTAEVRILLENLYAGRCDYPPREEIVALMNRLSTIPMRTFENSGFHLLFSDLYVYYRELTPALVQLRRAYDLRQDPSFPIRQATLAASAGNYEDSLQFLQRAREADRNRGRFVPSRIDEIVAMERDLNRQLGVR